jgi:hypothetical protein
LIRRCGKYLSKLFFDLLIAPIALAFFDFCVGLAAAIRGERTRDFDAFLELARRIAADVLLRFTSVNELTTGRFATASACASRCAACFH